MTTSSGSKPPGPDFLSNLPVSIIEDILQRLPIRDSVRTSVLAKRWRYKWRGITQLIFDENCMKSPVRRVLTDKLASIINYILAQHQGQIHKFKLSVLFCSTDNAKTYITEWIDILSKRGLRDLTLENCIGSAFLVEDLPFGFEQLEVLKLKYWSIELNNSFNTFRHLKELHLEKISISADDFKSLTSKCPLLEKLTFFAVGQIPMSLPTMLNCVKDIFMAVNIMDLSQIAAAFCLIRSSPNLKRLRIGAWMGRTTYNAVDIANFWDKHNAHKSCFDHLNIVKVEKSTCAGFEIEFISYLLKNSPALEQMTVEVLDGIYLMKTSCCLNKICSSKEDHHEPRLRCRKPQNGPVLVWG